MREHDHQHTGLVHKLVQTSAQSFAVTLAGPLGHPVSPSSSHDWACHTHTHAKYRVFSVSCILWRSRKEQGKYIGPRKQLHYYKH